MGNKKKRQKTCTMNESNPMLKIPRKPTHVALPEKKRTDNPIVEMLFSFFGGMVPVDNSYVKRFHPIGSDSMLFDPNGFLLVIFFPATTPPLPIWLVVLPFSEMCGFRIFTFGTYLGKGGAIFRNMFLKAWNYYPTQ